MSVVGIVGYRGLQLGTFDTITGLNPYKSDKGMLWEPSGGRLGAASIGGRSGGRGCGARSLEESWLHSEIGTQGSEFLCACL